MLVLFYANGGEHIGLGHIYRCLCLASYLDNYDIVFASDDKKDLNIGHILVEEAGFVLHKIQGCNALSSLKADILIVDSYEIEAEFLTYIKFFFKKLVIVDDEGALSFYDVDLIINPNPYAKNLSYKTHKRTKTLFGTNLLRTEFQGLQKITINKEVKNIILSLGGSDDTNLSYLIAKNLEAYLYKLDIKLHIVIGKAFKYKKELLKLQNTHIICYENAQMSKLMLACDLGICGCGQTSYELLSLGIPIITLILASNQQLPANFGLNQGYLVVATPKNIALELSKMSFQKRLKLRASSEIYFRSVCLQDLITKSFYNILYT